MVPQKKPSNKILLVEDDKPIVNVLSNELKDNGYEIMIASEGEEGLRMALETHPDIILLDIIMPNMDGLAMLRQLREDSWGKDAKVVIVSNLSNQISELEAKKYNVLDYIIKTDLSLNELVEKIKKLL